MSFTVKTGEGVSGPSQVSIESIRESLSDAEWRSFLDKTFARIGETTDENGCIGWYFADGRPFPKDVDWRPTIFVSVDCEGFNVKVSRLLLYLSDDKPMVGEQANHTCDNGWCVNVDHLYRGTQQDNIDDLYERNPDPPQRIISNETVKALRRAYFEDEMTREGLLDEFDELEKLSDGTEHSWILQVLEGDYRKRADGPTGEKRRRLGSHITNRTARAIRHLYFDQGWSKTRIRSEVSDPLGKFTTSETCTLVNSVLKGATYTDAGGPTGETENERTKLTEDDVRTIRERVASGETKRELAHEFGVSEVNIGGICAYENYTSVGGPLTERSLDSDETVRYVRRVRNNGSCDTTQRELADELDTSKVTIRKWQKFNSRASAGGWNEDGEYIEPEE